MKFNSSVIIDAPLNKVVALFDNPDNLKYWQDGYIGQEHISGEPGKPGAKAKIIFSNRGRKMELVETIISKSLPTEVTALYEHEHMSNTATNRFTAIDGNKTRYETEVEYIKFNGLMPKLMAFLMPGMFKKPVQKWLLQFKGFAEKQA